MAYIKFWRITVYYSILFFFALLLGWSAQFQPWFPGIAVNMPTLDHVVGHGYHLKAPVGKTWWTPKRHYKLLTDLSYNHSTQAATKWQAATKTQSSWAIWKAIFYGGKFMEIRRGGSISEAQNHPLGGDGMKRNWVAVELQVISNI